MNITVLLKTLNEHANIRRFCKKYQWATTIMLCDGGSEDDTVSIALEYPNVVYVPFEQKVTSKNGKVTRNPEGKHTNFMIDWGMANGADWLVLDDCDSIPTLDMQSILPEVFHQADKEGKKGIMSQHIYLYKDHEWFPDMNKNGYHVWAWHRSMDVHAEDEDWGNIITGFPTQAQSIVLDFPYSFLHYFCPDEETINKKLAFYQMSGEMSVEHPLISCGKLAPVLPWMVSE